MNKGRQLGFSRSHQAWIEYQKYLALPWWHRWIKRLTVKVKS